MISLGRGSYYNVVVVGELAFKFPIKKEKMIKPKNLAKMYDELRDIVGILPATYHEEYGEQYFVQPKAKGKKMSEMDVDKQLHKEFIEWKHQLESECRKRGYVARDLSKKNVYYDGKSFQVVDIERFEYA